MASYWPTLGKYVEGLERAGKLVRVTIPINKDTELHPLVRLQFRGLPEHKRKAFLFENVVDSRGRKYDIPVLVGGLAGSTLGIALAKTGARVLIDADGYRERRAEVLRDDADDAAEEVLRTGRPVEFETLPSSERRIVHEYLRERGDVQTHSEGEEPQRHVVVSPLES